MYNHIEHALFPSLSIHFMACQLACYQ